MLTVQQQLRKGNIMKKAILTLGLLAMSAGVVQAQTSITPRSNTQLEAQASVAPTSAVITPVPTLTPTPVAQVTTTTTETTKGGMPVTASTSQTFALAAIGLAVMGFGAYKSLKA